MRIFITRHGQVATEAECFGDVDYPKGDMPLSALGVKQAHLLGKRLFAEGFSGRIFSSPYIRTLQTAEAIAEELGGAEIVKVDGLREICRETEDAEDVRYRAAIAMHDIMKENADVLIVGHGATVGGVLNYVAPGACKGLVANASYSFFNTRTNESIVNCVRHLPYDMITRNSVYMKEMPVDIDLPAGLAEASGTKILHIGDTHSRTYYWYRALINKLRPDVIIHTGDTADEIKVGNNRELEGEYLDRARVMLDILTESGAEVYWTSGNNDLEEKVAELAPSLKIIPNDTVLNIGGKRICVTHDKNTFTKEADVYLYGHTTRYEEWSELRNVDSAPVWYINDEWSVAVILLPERKLFTLRKPRMW